MKTCCLLSFVLILLWATTQALPVIPRQSSPSQTSPLEQTNNPLTSNSEIRPDCNDATEPTDYAVSLDQLVQHITTHWKFDHLDSIQTQSYKHIATQVQQHVRITVTTTTTTATTSSSSSSSSSSNQQTILNPSSLDAMDVDILMAQIFGAVQSHTQGKLPLEWDRLGDQLGKPALETYLRKIVMDQCGASLSLTDDVDNQHHGSGSIISAQCLLENSDQLSSQLDRYIGTHLTQIFETMDRHVLPDLLDATSDNLQGVLDYFNSVFLNKDDQELLLQVQPWQGSIKDTYVESILPSLNKDSDQPFHFFTRYTCLARV
ncbi:hypothetical protein BCR42DRAFT_407654 [Absidia repens]|uniref:Uncharacterized protein n=1 Tax=Absidia repens TaxID=90262 RepID=A0A1X2ISH9_9FUNG|nr:hypothetical protein BCR42DRAFT_407654 [Absidia repens]